MKKTQPKAQAQPPDLTFEEAMKKILHTPKKAVDKAIEKAKHNKGIKPS